jgi:ParB family chromosome partitioning protein
MSATESKAKAPKKASNKKITRTQEEALKAALEAAPVEYIPLTELVKSHLNVRTIPYSVESVRGLADSIEALGLLQNLIVHTLDDGKSGVAAGGRRLTALQLLAEEGRLAADYSVIVKRVSDDVAALASVAENEQRAAMHPAEQITGFRTLAAQGKTPAQIGDALGYGPRHVQRMLKLAGLAPMLLDLLAKDEITVEQCQALAMGDDHSWQVQVWEKGLEQFHHRQAPAHWLKNEITSTRMKTDQCNAYTFVGRADYEKAGGLVEEDLFSEQEGNGYVDRLLVEKLAQDKMNVLGMDVQQREGWAWMLVRQGEVTSWGDDARDFQVRDEPDVQLTEDEQAQLDELESVLEATVTCEDENEIAQKIEDIEQAIAIRAWTVQDKAECGIVVYLDCGEFCVQRGVQRLEQAQEQQQEQEREQDEQPEQESSEVDTGLAAKSGVEAISLPMLTKMSSERTLAVQAELMQQPEKAVALLTWKLCIRAFNQHSYTSDPFQISLTVSHYTLTENAPTGKNGAAYTALMQEKARLAALLPEGWADDFTTFFTLDGALTMSLMAFCTACSLDGVQTREFNRTAKSKLDALERSTGFHMRDWWTPTKENFFAGLKHNQIVEALNDAGHTGVAKDAGKMKKSDAAELAEGAMSRDRWVPDWMSAPGTWIETNVTVAEDCATDADTHIIPAKAA